MVSCSAGMQIYWIQTVSISERSCCFSEALLVRLQATVVCCFSQASSKTPSHISVSTSLRHCLRLLSTLLSIAF